MVPDEDERKIMTQVIKMRSEGYSLDEIRQYLNYTWKVRTRTGGEWTNSRVAYVSEQGLRLGLMARSKNGDREPMLDDVDDEEEFENLDELEDENNE
jgi:hypothetical protein